MNSEKAELDHAEAREGELTEEGTYGSTRTLGPDIEEEANPKWGTARFGPRMNLVLKIREYEEKFVFDADEIEEIVIGRRDPYSGDSPEVDLERFGALDKGVSRKHACIVRRDGSLNLVDQGSPNGTFLNGQRLVAQQPRILRDGDDVRLGHLVVRVTFRKG